ncbi:hypothetical protein CBM2623_A280003 [Cupriavidus taiwanensis]|nr:hypothetical protein CBM2623_A280003 [Cupriavidus taiwanensis]
MGVAARPRTVYPLVGSGRSPRADACPPLLRQAVLVKKLRGTREESSHVILTRLMQGTVRRIALRR